MNLLLFGLLWAGIPPNLLAIGVDVGSKGFPPCGGTGRGLCIFTPEGRVVAVNDSPGVLSCFEYNLKDHLGNTRVTFTGHSNGRPEVNQATSYDPYGFVTSQTSYYSTGSFQNRNLYNGKELQDDVLAGSKINWYDFGARFLDSELGIWRTRDPLAEKYSFASPYTYVLNNPVNAVDPDGQVVIFVNGQHGGSGGQKSYWGGIANQIMSRIGDHNAMYYDGASGGWLNTATRGLLTGSNLFAGNRERAGMRAAKRDGESIISGLQDGESIKVVSHSMGGAYSKGFIKGLQKYAEKNDIKINIEFEVDLAPFQPESQKSNKDVRTIQVSHKGDAVANTFQNDGEIEGAELNYTRPNEEYGMGEHEVSSFSGEIDTYIPKSQNNASGSSTWEEKRKKR